MGKTIRDWVLCRVYVFWYSCCTPRMSHVGVQPPIFSARFARSNICTPLWKLWHRPWDHSAQQTAYLLGGGGGWLPLSNNPTPTFGPSGLRLRLFEPCWLSVPEWRNQNLVTLFCVHFIDIENVIVMVILFVTVQQSERCGVFGHHLYQLPCSFVENYGVVPK